eukprot:13664-Eustigmatos_ZCMA.PRE.1
MLVARMAEGGHDLSRSFGGDAGDKDGHHTAELQWALGVDRTGILTRVPQLDRAAVHQATHGL